MHAESVHLLVDSTRQERVRAFRSTMAETFSLNNLDRLLESWQQPGRDSRVVLVPDHWIVVELDIQPDGWSLHYEISVILSRLCSDQRRCCRSMTGDNVSSHRLVAGTGMRRA